MTTSIQEGQELGGRYQLLQSAATSAVGSSEPQKWPALDSATSERVELTLLLNTDSDAEALLRRAMQQVRGLIHPNILRVTDVGREGDYLFAVQPAIRNVTTLKERGGSFRALWPIYEQLLQTLGFAHGAGVAHGHIGYDNLLVTPDSQVVIAGFGLPPKLIDPSLPGKPDIADDIHALGALLYESLTGHPWVDGQTFESNAPVSLPVRQLLTRMLDTNPYARPTDLSEITEILAAEAEGNEASELSTAGAFERAQPQPAPSATNTTTASATTSAHVPSRDQQQLPMGIVAAGMVVLLLLAVFVFFFLPQDPAPTGGSVDVVESTPAPAPARVNQTDNSEPAPAQLTPLQQAQMARFEEEGKELAGAIIRKQVELEDAGVQLWASAEFQALVEQAEAADALYRDTAFDEALAAYKVVLNDLTELQNRIPEVLARAIDAGKQALLDEDSEAAMTQWTIATVLAPGDAEYQVQLDRAVNLEDVLALLSSAEAQEANGSLTGARTDYRAAVDLDPMMQRATDGLKRTNVKITQRRFRDAMSEGFTGLANKDYDAARQSFEKAASILPNSDEPADGQLQIDIAERMDTVNEYRSMAEAAIRDENWQAAIDAYDAVLQLDETLLFATRGIENATSRLKLQEQMQPFLNQPDAMQDDDGLANARQLLVEASRIQGAGPKLRDDLTRLSRLISVARIPVEVVITSDNRTDVTVYKIGNFGSIDSQTLELVPGRYTVVGKRRGYRDVREDITVIGGQKPPPVHVSCTERV